MKIDFGIYKEIKEKYKDKVEIYKVEKKTRQEDVEVKKNEKPGSVVR